MSCLPSGDREADQADPEGQSTYLLSQAVEISESKPIAQGGSRAIGSIRDFLYSITFSRGGLSMLENLFTFLYALLVIAIELLISR